MSGLETDDRRVFGQWPDRPAQEPRGVVNGHGWQYGGERQPAAPTRGGAHAAMVTVEQERAAREAERAEFASYAHYMQAEMRKRDAGQGQQIEMLKAANADLMTRYEGAQGEVSALRQELEELRRQASRAAMAATTMAASTPFGTPQSSFGTPMPTPKQAVPASSPLAALFAPPPQQQLSQQQRPQPQQQDPLQQLFAPAQAQAPLQAPLPSPQAQAQAQRTKASKPKKKKEKKTKTAEPPQVIPRLLQRPKEQPAPALLGAVAQEEAHVAPQPVVPATSVSMADASPADVDDEEEICFKPRPVAFGGLRPSIIPRRR